MQTFLPYSDFKKSAQIIDWRRLGNQRVESNQILNIIKNGGRWKNHPAVLMWIGYENALIEYRNIFINEWINRGYNNNMNILPINGKVIYPEWLGNKKFHMSHKSKLYQKDPIFYHFWSDIKPIPYMWPVDKNNKIYKENIFHILGNDKEVHKTFISFAKQTSP